MADIFPIQKPSTAHRNLQGQLTNAHGIYGDVLECGQITCSRVRRFRCGRAGLAYVLGNLLVRQLTTARSICIGATSDRANSPTRFTKSGELPSLSIWLTIA